MQLIIRSYDLKLKHTFTISRQSFDVKRTMIVELKDGNISGFGEASENPYYHKTLENMIQDLQNCKEIIEEDTHETPEEFWTKMHAYLKEDMFALCALDIAYNDLYARKKDKKWPVYKIKLGTKNDIEIVKELRKHTDAIFRIDANCAWTVEETIKNAVELKKLGVEFLEQPLPAEDWEGSRKVYLESVLPIIADESCQVESDVEKCHDHFHGINIKLVKCGGLTPARQMLKKAKELGMNKMVGCMTESSIGISAIAHLLPELDYVDMDGAMLLSKDIANGVQLESGKIFYSDLKGTGVKLTDSNYKTIT